MERYRDRGEAGRSLVPHLAHHRGGRPLVIGVAGGGVPVAAVVAEALGGQLDVLASIPFGPPGNPDLPIGAVGADGIPVIEEALASRLGLSPADLDAEAAAAAARARLRERALRGGSARALGGRTVVVVDDGVAGGAVLRAALGLVRRGGPTFLACAVPVGLAATVDLIAAEVDEVVCPLQPLRFHTVGEWYEEYPEVGDEAVAALLRPP